MSMSPLKNGGPGSVTRSGERCSSSTVETARIGVMRHSPHHRQITRSAVRSRFMASSGVRLADLMVSLSLVTDLGFGQPSEHMLRSARIGMRLGERLGLTTDELATLYDVGILTYVGCPVYGNEAAVLFGDDMDF